MGISGACLKAAALVTRIRDFGEVEGEGEDLR